MQSGGRPRRTGAECARHSSRVSASNERRCCEEMADQRADDLVRIAERHALARPGSRRRRSPAADPTRRLRSCRALSVSPPITDAVASRRGAERIFRLEQRLLVFLQILAVADRQALHGRQPAGRTGRCTRPALPRTSSSGSGFFFCGIRLLPVAAVSASSKKPNSSDVKRMQILGEPAEVHHRQRGRVQEGRDEVAIAGRVDAVGDDAGEAERGGQGMDVDRIAGAGNRARAERQLVDFVEARRRSRA